ncbi:nuclear transport factor 2 family protein [Saccharomonospora azurea]
MAAERETLSPECRADPARLRRLLAPNLHEFGSSGRQLDVEAAVRVAAETASDTAPIRMHRLRGQRVADGVVMQKYTSEYEGRRAHRTSLWRRVGPGRWQLFHHQGTPVAPDES